jgi:hypothetical protein
MEVLVPTQERSRREDELLAVIEDLKAALAQRDETIRCTELKLDILQQMLFGRRSERLAIDDKDLQCQRRFDFSGFRRRDFAGFHPVTRSQRPRRVSALSSGMNPL